MRRRWRTPGCALADELTGNLDPRTAGRVFQALAQLVRASGLAAVIATHNMEPAQRMDRRVTLQEGRVVEGGVSGSGKSAVALLVCAW